MGPVSLSTASSAATGAQTGGAFTVNKGVPPWVLAALIAAAALVAVLVLKRKGKG